MDWYIYILLCDQKSYYIGLTHDLKQRLTSHKSKANMATKEFSDLVMVYHEKFNTRKEAEAREKQLKGWTRAKKKALIERNIASLIKLSKS
jgi:putative endonuclease